MHGKIFTFRAIFHLFSNLKQGPRRGRGRGTDSPLPLPRFLEILKST